MGFMYILTCADGSFYVGSTRDLERRIRQHNDGEGARYTMTRLPVVLSYFEEFDRIDLAYSREKQVQGWSRAKRIALISGAYDALPALSERAWRRAD
jgi:putative endonuclease